MAPAFAFKSWAIALIEVDHTDANAVIRFAAKTFAQKNAQHQNENERQQYQQHEGARITHQQAPLLTPERGQKAPFADLITHREAHAP